MSDVLSDCCLVVCLPDDAYGTLVILSGGIDPLAGEEVGWPAPRVYWSNGTITEGGLMDDDPRFANAEIIADLGS